MTKQKAVIELIFAGVLWGYGFLATKWALLEFSVFDLLFYRFLVAFILGELIALFTVKLTAQETINELKLAFLPGILMAAFIIPQTLGLKYTTATKSGFITTLYVIFVPFLNHFFFKEKTNFKIYLWAITALFGTTLLLKVFSESPDLNQGDFWTLVCSLMAATQIIFVGKVASVTKSAFKLNNFQSLWTLISLIPFYFFQDKITFSTQEFLPWFGVISMAIGSSILAFTIQLRAQKVLNSAVASLLFLLESPFAFMFGYLFLKEKLSLVQLLGALLIICSSMLSLREEQTLHSK
ncbi:MAG: DMT family transporter [Bdellovibrionaceae bacterium]|nr:DMT family transporter [Pseudobdellovibrionaceae bacterium]